MRRLAGAAILVALLGTACARGDLLEVQARFADVADLAPSAPVMLSDIKIGEVKRIELDGDQALVTMRIEPDANVPQGVVARVRRTSLLGERIVDLQIPSDLPANAPLLADGALIRLTEVRPDLEDLVKEGSDVLAPIAASELAILVDEGAIAFGDSGDELESLIRNLGTIVEGYAANTDDVVGLIRSMNAFNTVVAKEAEAHGLALQNSRRALDVLREETDELEKAIESLNRLSKGANGIFEAHFDEMDRFFDQARVILDVLRAEQRSLEGILRWGPLHNRNTQLVEFQEFNQVFQDFVICGFNDDPTDPARTCEADTPNPRESGAG